MNVTSGDGTRIHIEIEGTGTGPTLVLVHGFYGSLEDWRELGWVEVLAPRYRLLLVDQRGHGLSDKPHDPAHYSPAACASDILAALEVAGADRAAYFGFSRGGWLGFVLMGMAPARFEVWAIASAHPFAMETALLRQGLETLDEWAPTLATSEARKSRFLGNDRAALAAAVSEDRADLSPGLSSLLAPCLFLCGGLETRLLPRFREAAALAPRGELRVLPDLGHDGLVSAGRVAGGELLGFLDRHFRED